MSTPNVKVITNPPPERLVYVAPASSNEFLIPTSNHIEPVPTLNPRSSPLPYPTLPLNSTTTAYRNTYSDAPNLNVPAKSDFTNEIPYSKYVPPIEHVRNNIRAPYELEPNLAYNSHAQNLEPALFTGHKIPSQEYTSPPGPEANPNLNHNHLTSYQPSPQTFNVVQNPKSLERHNQSLYSLNSVRDWSRRKSAYSPESLKRYRLTPKVFYDQSYPYEESNISNISEIHPEKYHYSPPELNRNPNYQVHVNNLPSNVSINSPHPEPANFSTLAPHPPPPPLSSPVTLPNTEQTRYAELPPDRLPYYSRPNYLNLPPDRAPYPNSPKYLNLPPNRTSRLGRPRYRVMPSNQPNNEVLPNYPRPSAIVGSSPYKQLKYFTRPPLRYSEPPKHMIVSNPERVQYSIESKELKRLPEPPSSVPVYSSMRAIDQPPLYSKPMHLGSTLSDFKYRLRGLVPYMDRNEKNPYKSLQVNPNTTKSTPLTVNSKNYAAAVRYPIKPSNEYHLPVYQD